MILVTSKLFIQMVVNDNVTFTYFLSLKTVCCMLTKHVSSVPLSLSFQVTKFVLPENPVSQDC